MAKKAVAKKRLAKKLEPGHISDWAARCAEYIAQSERQSSVSRLAAVIEYFATPLITALKAARRGHTDSCPLGPIAQELELRGHIALTTCTCGADEWNKRIDSARE